MVPLGTGSFPPLRIPTPVIEPGLGAQTPSFGDSGFAGSLSAERETLFGIRGRAPETNPSGADRRNATGRGDRSHGPASGTPGANRGRASHQWPATHLVGGSICRDRSAPRAPDTLSGKDAVGSGGTRASTQRADGLAERGTLHACAGLYRRTDSGRTPGTRPERATLIQRGHDGP